MRDGLGLVIHGEMHGGAKDGLGWVTHGPFWTGDNPVFSRRRRTYIQVYPLHHSPRFLECPCHPTAPTLSRAMDRPCSHIESRPESQRTGQEDSMEGRGGRTPRRRSDGRLYRGLCAGTHSQNPCRARIGILVAPKAHLHPGVSSPPQSPIPEVSVS